MWDLIVSVPDHCLSFYFTMYQVGAAGSYGYGTSDRTCLHGIRSGLQDLAVLVLQIILAY